MEEMYRYAMKLLAGRDYTTSQIRRKLENRFGRADETLIEDLTKRGFLDDRRFARNYIARKGRYSPELLRLRLLESGVDDATVSEELEVTDRPSLADVVKATMLDWNLHAPLHPRDAVRLFRALRRLGYEEDAIREELEPFHG